MKSLYHSLVVKVGSNVITREDGLLDEEIMESLVEQIAELRKQGIQVILVSSGAMAAGRGIVKPSGKIGRVAVRQVLASVGQIKLINMYEKLFGEKKIVAAQLLATKEDFRDREHYLNMRKLLDALLKEDIIPVVNENDAVSITELMFTDNDELAGLIAAMMNTDALILLTNVQGIYTGNPNDPTRELLSEIDAASDDWRQYIHAESSQFGRGGMFSKCRVASRCAKLGITTHIASGRRAHVLTGLIKGEKIGTVFKALKQETSVKRWMAGSEGRGKARIHVNEGAATLLRDPEQTVSLLPIGITKIEGEFERGDLLKIMGPDGVALGLGQAKYGSSEAKKALGKKGEKALIHYDYLFLFS